MQHLMKYTLIVSKESLENAMIDTKYSGTPLESISFVDILTSSHGPEKIAQVIFPSKYLKDYGFFIYLHCKS